jgi:hypothetical protein
MKYIDHLLMSGQTVTAIVKHYNGYDLEQRELEELLDQFYLVNQGVKLTIGQRVKVPVKRGGDQ